MGPLALLVMKNFRLWDDGKVRKGVTWGIAGGSTWPSRVQGGDLNENTGNS